MGKIWVASNADFVKVLQGLLPRGVIWTREPARRLPRLLQGIADELVRVQNSAGTLMTEADPQTTTSTGGLLGDWERVLGLPEFTGDPTPSDPDATRRAAIMAKLTSTPGGQSAAYFEALALQLGATADVYDGPFQFVWTVSIPTEIERFRAGTGRAGDGLISFSALATRIRDYFEKYKPAHTFIWWVGA